MGCKSCSSGSCGTISSGETKVGGCQNNGACSSGGCNKMNVFDWLSNMEVPSFQKFNIVEIKFKGGRKEFFRNTNRLNLHAGDPVVLDVPNGHHIGYVSLQGELVRLQMLKKSIKDNDDIRPIYRIANEKDLEKYEQAVARDLPTLYRTREMLNEMKLDMKLSDVEFQADNSKAIFYYTSDDRVDFRELIKNLASEFKIRVEMKQISLRQEAGRVGGIGVCGRELCCSTWLTEFKNVNTSAARYQNLSLNPVKLSGQCGRLKCCLNYELETYMDALKSIPTLESRIKTKKGDAILQKTDIFKKIMWFGYIGEESNWIPVPVSRVNEIVELNKTGFIPDSFEVLENIPEKTEKSTPATLNSDLDRMDKKYSKSNRNNQNRFKKRESTDPLKANKSTQNKDRNENKTDQKQAPREQRPPQKRPERSELVARDNKPKESLKPVSKPVEIEKVNIGQETDNTATTTPKKKKPFRRFNKNKPKE
ncbi:MAG: Signal peptidase-like protein [Pseudarcicella sp.]|nr:Signal peptidase-like protein [Pseudarcicella sp.]